MKWVKFAITLIGAVTLALSSMVTANAEPAPAVHFVLDKVGHSAVLSIDSGSLRVNQDHLEVRDAAGNLIVGLPLSYMRGDQSWPIAAAIAGRTATMTPRTDPAAAVPAPHVSALLEHPVAFDFQSPAFATALGTFATILTIGLDFGTIIGSLVGGALGCLIGGALVGSAPELPTMGTLVIPGPLGGCLVTGVAGAGAGGVVGTIAFGGASLILGGLLMAAQIATEAAGH
jgi:hypothetical protein